ncbi:MAG: tRNA (N(6)-L-threonylcarbamoyladenosine(37)-C(2))-methylthiotransferase MtaB [Treponema sp.]|nr:tRNA (N(6)-L-threonylcarbamoyladenosine(37)-C(2))-methylthiotransferase MtaB [Treponema sp.]
MEKTVHFETLGCRLNHDESEGAARAFVLNGFNADMEEVTARTSLSEQVILSVINTCTVTGKAEQKARRIIRLLHEKFPAAPIIVTGCYAELDSDEIKNLCPDRIVIIPGPKKYLLSLLAHEMSHGGLLDVWDGRFDFNSLTHFIDSELSKTHNGLNPFSLFTPVFEKHSRGSIKIQDGCNCSCTFCRIHLARGKSLSLDASTLIKRIQEMEKLGLKEAVLTGVNLSQYSSSYMDEKINFARLINLILQNTDDISLRISSLYPQSVNDELCRSLESPRVQPFFHLSIQSGSDEILRKMNRPHSVAQVEEAIENLRKVKDNPFISCDIIAGFPGEGEAEFGMTQSLVEKSRFAWIHAFPFSPRPGTPAKDMRPQVPEREKGFRVRWLTEMAVRGKIDYIREWKGRTLSAIVENSRTQRIFGVQKIHAVTENFLHVECPLPDFGKNIPAPGSRISVCIGEPLEASIRGGREIECAGQISFS